LKGKLLGHEADHSPASSATFRICGALPPLPYIYIYLPGVVLNEAQGALQFDILILVWWMRDIFR